MVENWVLSCVPIGPIKGARLGTIVSSHGGRQLLQNVWRFRTPAGFCLCGLAGPLSYEELPAFEVTSPYWLGLQL